MSLESDIRLLATVPLLAEFTEDKLRLIAFSAENRVYRDGQRLFQAGDRADSGYVVASGAVALHPPGRGPDEPFEVVHPPGLIGELSLIAEGEQSMTATALGAVTVVQIRRALFRRMLDEYPEVAQRLQTRIAARLVETSRSLMRVKARLDRIGDG